MVDQPPSVAILMGSQSDWSTLRHAAETLDSLGVTHDDRIVSAHRTPDRLITFAKGARRAGYKVIIAGAGGAAHLPGMVASMTPLPVLGVPIESKALGGRHSGRHARHRPLRRDQCRAPRRRGAGSFR
jgi:5-(carboxyamino)imidazole ribonucleotide mutase